MLRIPFRVCSQISTSLKFILQGLLILLVVHSALAQSTSSRRVLFVGNSYTYFWNLPQQVSTMCEAADIPLTTRKSASGGATLGDHWRGDKNLHTREIIAKGEYDAIVFQGHSMSTIEFEDSLIYYGQALCSEIPSPDVRRYVFMTWAREWNPIMQDTITAGYEAFAESINATVIPVGLAWRLARQLRPELELYDEDGSHPSTLGSYLSACVFYGAFTDKSPVGLPNRLITTDKDGEILYLNIQSKENAEFCQRIAEMSLQQYAKN